MSDANDMKTLKSVAQDVLKMLTPPPKGIRLRPTITLKDSTTKGWRVELAGMGAGEPRFELWFCHWADPRQRRFWYGFYAAQAETLRQNVEKLPDYLQPERHFSERDMRQTGTTDWVLKVALKKDEFNKPLYEEYYGEYSYYGMFDPIESGQETNLMTVVQRATAFFKDVIRRQQLESEHDIDDSKDYTKAENRRLVRQHLSRERSSALAEERKIRDGYRCLVCQMSFKEVYGEIGECFAEAHHVVPLSRLETIVKSSLKDLITVCSNCHRMLHRMKGEAGDVEQLKRMLASH